MNPNQPQGFPPTQPPQPDNQPVNPFGAPQPAPQPQWQQPAGPPPEFTQQPPLSQPQAAPQPQPQFQPQAQPQQPAAPAWQTQSPDSSRTFAPEGVAPIDYLNQIATTQKKGLGFSRKQLLIVGAVVIVGFIGIAGMALFRGLQPNVTEISQRVSARIIATTDIVKNAQKNIKNTSLSTTNSSLAIQLSSATTELTKALAEANVDVSKLPKNIVAEESGTELSEKLEDARLNSIFDKVYAREMSYQIKTILIDLQSIYNGTKKQELKTYLESVFNNLEPLQTKLEEFSAGP